MSKPTYEELTIRVSELNNLIKEETDPEILAKLDLELTLVEEVIADTIAKGTP